MERPQDGPSSRFALGSKPAKGFGVPKPIPGQQSRPAHNGERLTAKLTSLTIPIFLTACTTLNPTAPAPVAQSACPADLMGHAQFVMKQVPRVRLGSDKLTTQSLLGNPLRAESFLLNDGQMVEVLSYPTPEGACPQPGRLGQLMPFVFQNNRLIGYGADYYRDFVVPTLKTPLSLPPTPPTPQQSSQVPANVAPSAGNSYPRRIMQEDLPNQAQPDIIVADPDEQGSPLILPAEYAVDPRARPAGTPQLGRGTPLN